MVILLLVISVGVILVACYMRNHTATPAPTNDAVKDKKLLSLTETTLAEQQRYYNRGFRQQLQYDELQRRAEDAGDIATLEAIRLGTYEGPLPTLHEDIQRHIKVPVGSPDGENAPIQELQYFCIKDKGYHVSVWPKDQGIGDYLEFPIAGITYGENVDDHLGEFVATLEPDPANPYDSNAIKILASNGDRVGYVPKDQTQCVRDFTSIPCHCFCYIGNNDGVYFTDCYINVSPNNFNP